MSHTVKGPAGRNGLLPLFLSVSLLFSSCVLAADAGDQSRPFPKPLIGQLASEGSFSYRVGVGTWFAQTAGTFPVVTPFEVRTGPSYCRVVLGSQNLFEGAPASEFALSTTDGKEIILTVRKGTVLYALADGTALRLNAVNAKVEARAGEMKPAEGVKPRPITPRAAHTGIVQANEGRPVELHNLKGLLALVEEGGRNVVVAAGQSLRVSGEALRRASTLTPGATASAPEGTPVSASGESVSGIRSVGSWWVFESAPRDAPVGARPDMVVVPSVTNRWLPVAPPPEVRERMSPWLPPGRRRGTVPEQPPTQPPWEPPSTRRR